MMEAFFYDDEMFIFWLLVLSGYTPLLVKAARVAGDVALMVTKNNNNKK